MLPPADDTVPNQGWAEAVLEEEKVNPGVLAAARTSPITRIGIPALATDADVAGSQRVTRQSATQARSATFEKARQMNEARARWSIAVFHPVSDTYRAGGGRSTPAL